MALSILSVPVENGIAESVVWNERLLWDVEMFVERRAVKGSHPSVAPARTGQLIHWVMLIDE